MSKHHHTSGKYDWLDQAYRERWKDMDDEMVDYRTSHPDADDDEAWDAISNIQIDRMSARYDQAKEKFREQH